MVGLHAMKSWILLLLVPLVLAGCARNSLDDPPVPLGDFKLGFNVVVAKNAKKVPPSRTATAEEWEQALRTAMARRFGRYDGDRIYHIGVNVDGYALAVPGIPVVLAPKSILVISANVWDDAEQKKLNEEARQIHVFEGVNGATIVGTGLTRSKEKQMVALADNAAKAIEKWLVRNRAEWFGETSELPEDLADEPEEDPALKAAAAQAGAPADTTVDTAVDAPVVPPAQTPAQTPAAAAAAPAGN